MAACRQADFMSGPRAGARHAEKKLKLHLARAVQRGRPGIRGTGAREPPPRRARLLNVGERVSKQVSQYALRVPGARSGLWVRVPAG